MLGEKGYNTYMLGKWHCCPEDETNMASTKRNWPTGRGFERYYGFLGGETNQWYPDLVQDQQFVEQPAEPPKDWAAGMKDGDYHLSADLVDHAIGMIADAKQVAPETPVLHVLLPRRQPRPASLAQGVGGQVQGQVRHGLREDPRDDPGEPDQDGHRPARTPNSRRSTRYADRKSVDGKPWSPLRCRAPVGLAV